MAKTRQQFGCFALAWLSRGASPHADSAFTTQIMRSEETLTDPAGISSQAPFYRSHRRSPQRLCGRHPISSAARRSARAGRRDSQGLGRRSARPRTTSGAWCKTQ